MKLEYFGFTKGINEVIGITFGEWINTAPLGIIVDNPKSRFASVKVYPSHTRENLKRGILYVNVTRDPVIFAISAFDDLDDGWFESLDPPVIKNTLAWCKFKADLRGNTADLTLVEGSIVRTDLRTVNRGFNALIEALVHATRLKENPSLIEKIKYYSDIVRKCGSERELEALEIMWEYLKSKGII